MKQTQKIIIDLDNTLTVEDDLKDYENAVPNIAVISRLKEYKALGYIICIFTARNMKTFEGNLGKINVHTLPVIQNWLHAHDVPYDEILIGKPWCGADGFYVDDRSLRPDEFVSLSKDEIEKLLKLS